MSQSVPIDIPFKIVEMDGVQFRLSEMPGSVHAAYADATKAFADAFEKAAELLDQAQGDPGQPGATPPVPPTPGVELDRELIATLRGEMATAALDAMRETLREVKSIGGKVIRKPEEAAEINDQWIVDHVVAYKSRLNVLIKEQNTLNWPEGGGWGNALGRLVIA